MADSAKARFSPKAAFNDSTDIATIKQLEENMGDARVAVDIEKLNQVFADDWTSIGPSGKKLSKESLLGDLKSGKDKLVSFELGPVDVQVLRNVAVAHGGVTEKRMYGGKDISELVRVRRTEG